MISVQEVVGDPDMTDPQPFVVQRTLGEWQVTGFVNTQTTLIPTIGPVRVATDRELKMVNQADIVGQTRAFYAAFPLLLIHGNAPTPTTAIQSLVGTVPGVSYELSTEPRKGFGDLYKNGALQTPLIDYVLVGTTITLSAPTVVGDRLWFTSPQTAFLQAANSDLIAYDNSLYRVIAVYRTPGSGYWKAIGTRLQAA